MDTIKSNEEISRVFSEGKRYSNPYATFIAVKAQNALSEKDGIRQHDPCGRVAFIAGKKNGNAVWRNGAKRRLREIYRAHSISLRNLDILFIARRPILDESYSKVLQACERTLKRFEA